MFAISSSALLFAAHVASFPWVLDQPGVRTGYQQSRSERSLHARDSTCPNNPNHPGAVPINDQYPYLGAINGKKGTEKGGIQVPTPGDTAHYFQPPGPLDIRGPCPGLNAAANHGFISRDGITTFDELLDAQQNVYNVGYDLAIILATLGVGLDGDLLTQKLSIGCDATSRTSATGSLLGDELGLNGHNKFEADTSLTRNDYFLANGDDYHFNSTLFGMMMEQCNGNCDVHALSKYRYNRYQQSVADNGQFFFGPASVLLYGAASFLYQLFPSYGPEGVADEKTMMSFFGANKTESGTYVFNNAESIPAAWFNRRDSLSGGVNGTVGDILAMYTANPVLFGGNIGPGDFNALNFSSYIVDGKLRAGTAQDVTCLVYQLVASGFPSSLEGGLSLTGDAAKWVFGKLSPVLGNIGCPRDSSDGF